MKIRDGFVSNSSSSSFMILGVRTKASNVLEALGDDKFQEILDDQRGLVYYDSENTDDWVYYGEYDMHSSEDDWTVKPTKMLSQIKKDEKLGDFKDRITEDARKMFCLDKKAKFEFGLFSGIVAS